MFSKLLLTLMMVLICSPAWSATQLLHTVCESGCDFAKLNDATAHLASTHSNLVTGDVYADVKICGSSSCDNTGGWALPDTTAVTVSGITTDATRYINIYTTGSARHDGRAASVSGGGNYRLIPNVSGNTNIMNIAYNTVCTVDGLEVSIIQNIGGQTDKGIVSSSSSNVQKIINNIIHHMTWGISLDGNGYAVNNIIYEQYGYGIYAKNQWSNGLKILNNTVYKINYSGGFGIVNASSISYTISNNLVISVTGASYSGNKTSTNGSSDTTGTAGLQNLTASNLFVSVTADSEDLHLKSGASAIDVGTDLSSPYNTDIIGTSRPQGSAWDIGAFEYVATSSASGKSIIRNSILRNSLIR